MTNRMSASASSATRAIAALCLLLHLVIGPTLVLAQDTVPPTVAPPSAAPVAPVAPAPPDAAPAMPPPADAMPPASVPTEPPPMAAAPLAPMAPTAPVAPEPPPMPPAPLQPSKTPAYILWGAGGVSLIVGTIFGASTLTAKNHFDDHPTYSSADSVHDRSIACDVGLGLGLILALAGTVFYVVAGEPVVSPEHADKQPNSNALRPNPVFSSRAGGGALTLHF